jgi:aryl-alcohol dehydrogenase-like predicted oxidoreductase/enamine deaminase RidA (YjgF/YER057c/UK114 family)
MQDRIELANGLEISRVITGLWQIADMERNGNTLDPVKASRHMEPYLNAGLSTFDMADHYGSSEIIAGAFKISLQDNSEVQLFTKWVPKPGKISREEVRGAVETALNRMQQSSIDLLQFHAWHYPDPSWLDGLFYLKELQEEGLIQHLGVTNFDAAHLRIAVASGIPLVSNQVCHSLLDRRAESKMSDVCREYNVKLLAFGTLAGGFLTDRWLGQSEPANEELRTWSQMKYKRFIDAAGGWEPYQNLLQSIKVIADKHNASIANIATRYILENEVVAGVIVGARLGESEHIQDNKSMLDITLDLDDIEKIKKAQNELKNIPGDCGDEYRKPPFLTASGDLSDHLESIPKAFEPVKNTNGKEQIFSGTEWEKFAGYCRAVKFDNRIHVSGTTATHGSLMIGGADAAAQTHFVIDKIEGVIESFGGSLADVVRTRIFVNKIDDWEQVARAHGERFQDINPANTLVEAKLVGEGYLVEIEAEAIVNQ